MLRYLLPRIFLPLLILLLMEGLFRSDFWERFAAPDSHAGTSIQIKQAIADEQRAIDFVTLGSSRAVYGLDHARIAADAARHGKVHANISMPGAHWLSVMAQIDWLRTQRPQLEGGIIALSIADMLHVGNGNYELAIVRPFQSVLSDHGGATERFDWHDPASYGSMSALYQYRGDIRSALFNPWQRARQLRASARSGPQRLFDGPRQQADVCTMPWATVAVCAAHKPGNADEATVVAQCASMAESAGKAGDWSALAGAEILAPIHQQTLDQRQAELRSIDWKRPPLVILLPITHHWSHELLPGGARAWAHRILDPLVADGSIQLLDYSDFFDVDGVTRCDVFWDIYHQNEKGMRELTDALQPDIERYLHAPN